MTTDTPGCNCLYCGIRLGAATGLCDDEPARPGSLTICVRCGAVMVLRHDLTVRGMTSDEMDRLENDKEMLNNLARHTQAIRMMPLMPKWSS